MKLTVCTVAAFLPVAALAFSTNPAPLPTTATTELRMVSPDDNWDQGSKVKYAAPWKQNQKGKKATAPPSEDKSQLQKAPGHLFPPDPAGLEYSTRPSKTQKPFKTGPQYYLPDPANNPSNPLETYKYAGLPPTTPDQRPEDWHHL